MKRHQELEQQKQDALRQRELERQELERQASRRLERQEQLRQEKIRKAEEAEKLRLEHIEAERVRRQQEPSTHKPRRKVEEPTPVETESRVPQRILQKQREDRLFFFAFLGVTLLLFIFQMSIAYRDARSGLSSTVVIFSVCVLVSFILVYLAKNIFNCLYRDRRV